MPHLFDLTIRNYRVLRNVTFQGLQPLSVVLGPNGCGKSSLFDAIGFLSDCLSVGVRKALEPRGRLAELRSRGQHDPVSFDLKFRESGFKGRRAQQTPLITYHIEIDEQGGKPLISREYLRWTRGSAGKPYNFLDMVRGSGYVITGDLPEREDERRPINLADWSLSAIATVGQLAENPRVASLRRFIASWFLSYFVPDQARQIPEAGVKEHLSRTGANLPNVAQYLAEEHEDVLRQILERLTNRIPGLESVAAERTIDGRLVLRFKDKAFEDPFLSRFVSDGTLKMFAYLVLLMDPEPPSFLCVEEPENGLHPKLLHILAEEFRAHSQGTFARPNASTQVLVSSHSPFFIDALRPEELWVMERGSDGFAGVVRADRLKGIPDFVLQGASLGSLWFEGQFRRGNP